MEIYKLRDDVAGDTHQSDLNEKMAITDLKQGVKNPNRVNVFVDGKFAFSLDVAQVVDMGVKIGRVLTDTELQDLKKASEFGKAYQRALEWVLMRPRSERELRDYLRRRRAVSDAKERQKEWKAEREIAELIAKGEELDAKRLTRRRERLQAGATERAQYDFTDTIIERLVARGYVDDRKFAEYYVENRFVKKGISRRRLEMELMHKGVAKDIIAEVLGARSDEEEIRKIIAKKRERYSAEKLTTYLVRQGFSYELVKRLIEECESDEKENG